jgi:hypothetical protein
LVQNPVRQAHGTCEIGLKKKLMYMLYLLHYYCFRIAFSIALLACLEFAPLHICVYITAALLLLYYFF